MSLGNQSAYPHTSGFSRLPNGQLTDLQGYGVIQEGMTIRQRYAMAAMQALISAGWTIGVFLSIEAFKQADAMIAVEEEEENVRGKTTTNEASEAGQELGDKTAQG